MDGVWSINLDGVSYKSPAEWRFSEQLRSFGVVAIPLLATMADFQLGTTCRVGTNNAQRAGTITVDKRYRHGCADN